MPTSRSGNVHETLVREHRLHAVLHGHAAGVAIGWFGAQGDAAGQASQEA